MKWCLVLLFFLSFKVSAQLGENPDPVSKKGLLERSLDSSILELAKTFSVLQEILFNPYDERFIYKIPFKDPITNPHWRSLGGNDFRDIAVGDDGKLYALRDSQELYKLDNGVWVSQGVRGIEISGGPNKGLCLIGKDHGAYVIRNGKWIKIRGKVSEFICLGDDQYLAIDYESGENIFLYENGLWRALPGVDIISLSATQADDFYALRIDQSIWHFQKGSWKRLKGKMKSVAISLDGKLIGIGLNYGAYRYLGDQWVPIRGVDLVKIVALKNHQLFGLTSRGEIWKSFLYSSP